jgi:glycosyltransferase involved in cell wall biosynthesis
VVDDGSRDETAALVQQFVERDPRIRLLRNPTPSGFAAPARNRGFQVSNPQSRYVSFLDHDDVWKPCALKMLIDALEANPDAVGAHGLWEEIDAEGRRLHPDWNWVKRYERKALAGRRLITLPPEARTTFAALAAWCCFETPGLVLSRRSALPPADPFPLHNGTGLDWDLWLLMSRQGEFVLVNHVILGYRKHEGSASRNTKRLHERIYSVRRRLWDSPEFAAQRGLIRGSYRALERHYVRGKFALAAQEWRTGNRKNALRQCAYAGRHLWRWLRGCP